MHMWSTSLLKLNDTHMSNAYTKDSVFLDLSQMFLVLHLNYLTTQIWEIIWSLIRPKMVLYFFAIYIHGHGDEESGLSFFLNNGHCILVPLVIPSVRVCVRYWQYIHSPTLLHLIAPVSILDTRAQICLNLPLVVVDQVQFASFFSCPVINNHLLIQLHSQMEI